MQSGAKISCHDFPTFTRIGLRPAQVVISNGTGVFVRLQRFSRVFPVNLFRGFSSSGICNFLHTEMNRHRLNQFEQDDRFHRWYGKT